jgi:ADP-ribose pyrophosphatase YjhB (NUDIX family)
MAEEIMYEAGGIVWKRISGVPKIALRYKKRLGGQWTLPKGNLLDDESWKVAAIREVEQEIGEKVRILDHADTIHYQENGKPRVVSYWHMKAENMSTTQENGQHDIGWFTLREAFEKINYDAEQHVIRRLEPPINTDNSRFDKGTEVFKDLLRSSKILLHGKSRYERLRGEIETFRDEFNVRIQEHEGEQSAERVSQIMKMLHRSERELHQGNIDIAWKIFTGAKRTYLYGLSRSERKEEVKVIREEAQQLSDWRRKAIEQLIGDREHPRKEFEVTADLLVKASKIRDEEWAEEHFRSSLLRNVYMVLLPVLVVLIALAWVHLQANDVYAFFGVDEGGVPITDFARLSWGVILFGMLGACVSALLHAYDSAELSQSPETVTHYVVTAARVMLGGVMALIIFIFLQTDFVSQIFTFSSNPQNPFSFYAISFLVGFSERLVLRTLTKTKRATRKMRVSV